MASPIFCFLVILTALAVTCDAYRALVVTQMVSQSHALLNDGIVKQLLKDGNEVTYIRAKEYKNAPPTLRQIDISNNVNYIPAEAINIQAIMNKTIESNSHRYVKGYLTAMAIATLENENVQKFLSDPNEHFDVVVVEFMDNDVLASLATLYNCPLIWMSPIEVNSDILRRIDQLPNPAYVPDSQSSNAAPFSFQERVKELWHRVKATFLYYTHFDDLHIDAYNRLVVPHIKKRGRVPPSFEELRYNASLVLGYSHVSAGEAVGLPQSYKPVGGYHISENIPPLPEDIQKIMDNAEHGVIYFSMGSNLRSSDWPNEVKQNMVKMLGSLKQTVLWKFEEQLPNTYKNLYISNWFPQLSVLSHPNCILFISHGGLLSVFETLHAGVPFIGIPGFADQFVNTIRAERKGYGLKVDMSYNVVEDLKPAIEKITSNSTYRQKAKELSYVYHKRLVKPGDELAFWVRHVVETRGAPHLRSPALHLSLYQLLYLDLVPIILVALFVSIKLLRVACSLLCQKKKPENVKKATSKKKKN